jgi:hypothetical protein
MSNTRKEIVQVEGAYGTPVRGTFIYGDGWMNRLVKATGYAAMTIGRYIWAAAGRDSLSKSTVNHEMIHIAQQQGIRWLGVGFWGQWALYFGWRLWLFLGYKRGTRKRERPEVSAWREAYYNIPFEREAYSNQEDLDYLKNRSKNDWKAYRN